MEDWINNKLVPRLPQSWRESVQERATQSIHYLVEF